MAKKKDKYMIGVTVMIILLVLTLGEYMLGVVGATTGSWIFVLLLIATLKAYMVAREYMHISKVFVPQEEE
jgi:hypothetical protein